MLYSSAFFVYTKTTTVDMRHNPGTFLIISKMMKMIKIVKKHWKSCYKMNILAAVHTPTHSYYFFSSGVLMSLRRFWTFLIFLDDLTRVQGSETSLAFEWILLQNPQKTKNRQHYQKSSNIIKNQVISLLYYCRIEHSFITYNGFYDSFAWFKHILNVFLHFSSILQPCTSSTSW